MFIILFVRTLADFKFCFDYVYYDTFILQISRAHSQLLQYRERYKYVVYVEKNCPVSHRIGPYHAVP